MTEENFLKILLKHGKTIAQNVVHEGGGNDGVWEYFEGDALIPQTKEKVLEDMARDIWATSEIEINSSMGGHKWIGGASYNALVNDHKSSLKEYIRSLLADCSSPWYLSL